jgi:hypothetical protein
MISQWLCVVNANGELHGTRGAVRLYEEENLRERGADPTG